MYSSTSQHRHAARPIREPAAPPAKTAASMMPELALDAIVAFGGSRPPCSNEHNNVHITGFQTDVFKTIAICTLNIVKHEIAGHKEPNKYDCKS